MSLGKFLLIGLCTVSIVVIALLLWVLVSGRGILENPAGRAAADTEWLAVTETAFEFRGAVYPSKEALAVGLLQLQPKPQFVAVRWAVAGGTQFPREAVVVKVEEARAVLSQAHIATSEAIIGNEIFIEHPPTASRIR